MSKRDKLAVDYARRKAEGLGVSDMVVRLIFKDGYDAAVDRIEELEEALLKAADDICNSSCTHAEPRPHCPACDEARKLVRRRK